MLPGYCAFVAHLVWALSGRPRGEEVIANFGDGRSKPPNSTYRIAPPLELGECRLDFLAEVHQGPQLIFSLPGLASTSTFQDLPGPILFLCKGTASAIPGEPPRLRQ